MPEIISSSGEVKEHLRLKDILLLYFYNDACQPCLALRPKVESLMDRYPEAKMIYINSEQQPELNAAFEVFANPLIVLFVQGKESRRFSKYVALDQLEEAISRPYRIIYS
ncbi:MAG: thioredoxin family protein [Bacteroidales bacterium]|nr:thioredoxin family protein [Bacteroidales bacterium]MCF8387004.1 thioredoxin family protein [Bacteroidales bacterium]MCF8397353.1 thioredoxin family protein [Bacteroidales bacterium]